MTDTDVWPTSQEMKVKEVHVLEAHADLPWKQLKLPPQEIPCLRQSRPLPPSSASLFSVHRPPPSPPHAQQLAHPQAAPDEQDAPSDLPPTSYFSKATHSVPDKSALLSVSWPLPRPSWGHPSLRDLVTTYPHPVQPPAVIAKSTSSNIHRHPAPSQACHSPLQPSWNVSQRLGVGDSQGRAGGQGHVWEAILTSRSLSLASQENQGSVPPTLPV